MATIIGFTPEEATLLCALFYLFVLTPAAVIGAIIYAVKTTPKNRRKG